MRYKFLGAFFLLIYPVMDLFAQTANEKLLKELTSVIDLSHQYDSKKHERIEQVRQNFNKSNDKSDLAYYNFYLAIYEEYKIFKFDTAFVYAKKLEQIALKNKDAYKIVQSRTKLAFVLLSAGMYGEAEEIMKQIPVTGQPDSLKADYYLLKGRYYYDLADYVNDNFYYPIYLANAGRCLDSAVGYYSPSSFEYIYYTGLKQMKTGDLDRSFTNFHTLIGRKDLTDHQLAITASTLSYIYSTKGETDQAINYQIQAAIADIKSSTKETFAVLNLAQILFQQRDFKRASQYIKKAVDDATYYGARQRKIQVNSIMPIIQSSEINYIKKQRTSLIIYGAVVSFFLLVLAFLLVIIYRQNKKLQRAQKEISEAHNKLHKVNEQLQQVNTELQNVNANLLEVNIRLEEANKIKEEYVGYFFTVDAEFFQKIEKFKQAIEEKVHYGKFNEIKYVVNTINIKNEKEDLVKRFDRAFLKLFPHFVDEFNALFDEENQVKLLEGELLNTDLRIYALLRLGIKENEKIAEILEYSVKSIYAYKTKIRNKAKIPKEEFDKKVMEIKSI